jgi:hypothetical protein
MMTMPTAKKTLTTLFLMIVVAFCAGAQTLSEPSAYKLTAMNIVPYKHSVGSFLPEIKNDREYWGLNELDLSLFVTIEVSGRKGSYSPKRKVEITAYKGGRLFQKRVADLGVLDEEKGKYFVPLWLYGPFCQKITIKARLLGQPQASALQRTLSFDCGE